MPDTAKFIPPQIIDEYDHHVRMRWLFRTAERRIESVAHDQQQQQP